MALTHDTSITFDTENYICLNKFEVNNTDNLITTVVTKVMELKIFFMSSKIH